MTEEMNGWDPMAEDFESLTFNSYGLDQIGAHLPLQSLPSFRRIAERHSLPIRVPTSDAAILCVDGFPTDLTETGLKNFLKSIGCQIISVKLKTTDDPKQGRMAFVGFKTYKEANRAIQLIRSQNFFNRFFAYFVDTVNEAKTKEEILDKEFEDFSENLYIQNKEMRANGEISADEEPRAVVTEVSRQGHRSDADTSKCLILSPMASPKSDDRPTTEPPKQIKKLKCDENGNYPTPQHYECNLCGWVNKTKRNFKKRNRCHQFKCPKSDSSNLFFGRNQPLEKITKEIDDKISEAINEPKDYRIDYLIVAKEQFALFQIPRWFDDTVNINLCNRYSHCFA